MLRIAALNETVSSEDDPSKIQLTKTKEAKEAEAFSIYNKALLYEQKGNVAHAEKLLRHLFDHPLLKEAAELVEDEVQTTNHPGLQLLYSIHKNLASTLLQRDDLEEAMAAYIQAVKIDSSEVTVWYKMGQIARKIHNYPLAKICYLQGLQCNSNHWPCIDNAITVSYALGDYLGCMELISTALAKDCEYPKGLALRKQILKEQPSLDAITKELFEQCDISIYSAEVEKEEAQEYIDEAVRIRQKCRQLAEEERENEQKPVAFEKPLTPFTWLNVGEQLISLYDSATNNIPPKSLGLAVDLRDYFFLDQSSFLGPSEKKTVQAAATINGANGTSSGSKEVKEKKDLSQEPLPPERVQISVEKPVSESQLKPLEPMDTDDAFDLPMLGDMEVDAAIDLNDIPKPDLDPADLLLRDDDVEMLAMSDVRSLETVLSTVIDMEFASSEKKKMPEESSQEAAVAGEVSTLSEAKTGLPASVEAACSESMEPSKNNQEQAITAASGTTSSVQDSQTSTIEVAQTSAQEAKEANQSSENEKMLLDPTLQGTDQSETRPRQELEMSVDVHVSNPQQEGQVNKSQVSPFNEEVEIKSSVNFAVAAQPQTLPSTSPLPISQSSQATATPVAVSPKAVLSSPPLSSVSQYTAISICTSVPPTIEPGIRSPLTASLLSQSLTPNPPKTISDTGRSRSVSESSSLKLSPEKSPQKSDPSSARVQPYSTSQSPLKKNPLSVENLIAQPKKAPQVSPPYRERRTAMDLIEDVILTQMGKDKSPRSSPQQSKAMSMTSDKPQLSPSSHQVASEMSQGQSSVHQEQSPVSQQAMSTQVQGKSPVKDHSKSPSSNLEKSPTGSRSARQSPTSSSSKTLPGKSSHLPPLPPLHSSLSTPTLPLTHLHSDPHLYLPGRGSLSISDPLGQQPSPLPLTYHHLNTLSALEAEAVLLSSSEGQAFLSEWSHGSRLAHAAGSSSSRPRALSRSSSVPGYYTSPELSYSPFLSPPPAHSSVSPFFSLSRRPPLPLSHPIAGLLPPFSSNYPISALPPFSLPSLHQEFSSHLYSGLSSVNNPLTQIPISLSTTSKNVSHNSPSKSSASGLYSQANRTPPHQQASHSSQSPKSSLKQSPKQHSPKTSRPSKSSPSLVQNLLTTTSVPSHSQHLPKSLLTGRGHHSTGQSPEDSFQAMVESMMAANQSSMNQGSVTHSRSASKADGDSAKTKRGPKRKREDSEGLEELYAYSKRRSTRSRNTQVKKVEKKIDYHKVMKKYLPDSLLHQEPNIDKDEGRKEPQTSKMESDKPEADLPRSGGDAKSLKETEEGDVKEFVRECLKGHGILDLMFKFLLHLSRKSNCVWYEGVAQVYLGVYKRLREHLSVPSVYSGEGDFTAEGFCNYATLMLVWAELALDKAISERGTQSTFSPSKSTSRQDLESVLGGKYLQQDMQFLSSMTGREYALGPNFSDFCIRLYWLKARQHQLLHQTLDALDCFDIVTELLEERAAQGADEEATIVLSCVQHGRVISQREVKKLLDSLERCKSLEDTQRQYEQGNFSSVVENLISTFSQQSPSDVSFQSERPSQLTLLQDSLHSLGRHAECLQWAEVSSHEALNQYKRASTPQLRLDWAATLISLLDSIDKVLSKDTSLLSQIERPKLIRLSHNLVSVIATCLDVSDKVTEMPIGSVVPWKVLYRILRYEEDITGYDQGSKSDDEDDVRPSLTMLIDAHEYLGKHAWCTREEGSLLLFMMNILAEELESRDEDEQDDLSTAFEQCVYCLYGHPNKKGKARHLQDHNANPVTLTWEKSGIVFQHFAPQQVPEFDSYKTNTVSVELENLLRQIYNLVPDALNPAHHISEVTEYIEGVKGSPPRQPRALADTKTQDPHKILGQLYYLLADFYFKNKELTKAVKFYQMDLVLNSSRLDSWAGLALAKMSQIEQKLNSTELKLDAPINKKADAALRCFQLAVGIESRNQKLWLEFGSFVYQLHSHASRQLKFQHFFPLTEDQREFSTKKRLERLMVAKNCYSQANKCEGDDSEDDWLAFYMLGKIAEKNKEPPEVYLEFYKQAAESLHAEGALYPKKVQFVSTPPHLALEALEMFYRTHTSVIKLLLGDQSQWERHLPVLEKYVEAAFSGPFAQGEEKRHKVTAEEEREEVFTTPKATNPKPKPVYHKNPLDHEYSYYKSASDSQSSDVVDIENVPDRGQDAEAAQTGQKGSQQIAGHSSSNAEYPQRDEKNTGSSVSKDNVVTDSTRDIPESGMSEEKEMDTSDGYAVQKQHVEEKDGGRVTNINQAMEKNTGSEIVACADQEGVKESGHVVDTASCRKSDNEENQTGKMEAKMHCDEAEETDTLTVRNEKSDKPEDLDAVNKDKTTDSNVESDEDGEKVSIQEKGKEEKMDVDETEKRDADSKTGAEKSLSAVGEIKDRKTDNSETELSTVQGENMANVKGMNENQCEVHDSKPSTKHDDTEKTDETAKEMKENYGDLQKVAAMEVGEKKEAVKDWREGMKLSRAYSARSSVQSDSYVESSEEDGGAMSCGNEGDVDTDNLDVEEEDVISLSADDLDLSQKSSVSASSLGTSSQWEIELSLSERDLESEAEITVLRRGEAQNKDSGMVEVHAGESSDIESVGKSGVPPLRALHRASLHAMDSEGFSPQTTEDEGALHHDAEMEWDHNNTRHNKQKQMSSSETVEKMESEKTDTGPEAPSVVETSTEDVRKDENSEKAHKMSTESLDNQSCDKEMISGQDNETGVQTEKWENEGREKEWKIKQETLEKEGVQGEGMKVVPASESVGRKETAIDSTSPVAVESRSVHESGVIKIESGSETSAKTHVTSMQNIATSSAAPAGQAANNVCSSEPEIKPLSSLSTSVTSTGEVGLITTTTTTSSSTTTESDVTEPKSLFTSLPSSSSGDDEINNSTTGVTLSSESTELNPNVSTTIDSTPNSTDVENNTVVPFTPATNSGKPSKDLKPIITTTTTTTTTSATPTTSSGDTSTSALDVNKSTVMDSTVTSINTVTTTTNDIITTSTTTPSTVTESSRSAADKNTIATTTPTNTDSVVATPSNSEQPGTALDSSGNCRSEDPVVRRKQLLDRCKEGLELCAVRFLSHYKSLYRLAYIYYHSKEHKNLSFARDLLLGRADWQEQAHMPAPGLFQERKLNNFFQGLWKIPLDDIDRSGCFATHVHHAVQLLIDVLTDTGDLDLLKHLRHQLRRTPYAGKKYLRDAERLALADEALKRSVRVVDRDMDSSPNWSEAAKEENLARVYRFWCSAKGDKDCEEANLALRRAFRIMMKGRTDVTRLTSAQAILYCQQNLARSTQPSTPGSAQSRKDSQSSEKGKEGRLQPTPLFQKYNTKDDSMTSATSSQSQWSNSAFSDSNMTTASTSAPAAKTVDQSQQDSAKAALPAKNTDQSQQDGTNTKATPVAKSADQSQQMVKTSTTVAATAAEPVDPSAQPSSSKTAESPMETSQTDDDVTEKAKKLSSSSCFESTTLPRTAALPRLKPASLDILMSELSQKGDGDTNDSVIIISDNE